VAYRCWISGYFVWGVTCNSPGPTRSRPSNFFRVNWDMVSNDVTHSRSSQPEVNVFMKRPQQRSDGHLSGREHPTSAHKYCNPMWTQHYWCTEVLQLQSNTRSTASCNITSIWPNCDQEVQLESKWELINSQMKIQILLSCTNHRVGLSLTLITNQSDPILYVIPYMLLLTCGKMLSGLSVLF
jgi:hypothetical protein